MGRSRSASPAPWPRRRREREVLDDRAIINVELTLGPARCCSTRSSVGRQVHFAVEGDDFYVDPLLFHVEQRRYVVIELKIGKFKPDHLGQLGFYVTVVDDRLRCPGLHSPTVGILLCAGRNDAVVHSALANTTAPMAVAGYTSSPVDPDQLNLPRQAELEAILAILVTERSDATLTDDDA